MGRLGMTAVSGIEEVNMFQKDGNVLHFTSPKVQAAIGANTYAVSGHAENKALADLLPGIISQLGPDNLSQLRNIASNVPAPEGGVDDVPEVTENFDEVS